MLQLKAIESCFRIYCLFSMERLANELELPITKSVSDVFLANTSSDDN